MAEASVSFWCKLLRNCQRFRIKLPQTVWHGWSISITRTLRQTVRPLLKDPDQIASCSRRALALPWTQRHAGEPWPLLQVNTFFKRLQPKIFKVVRMRKPPGLRVQDAETPRLAGAGCGNPQACGCRMGFHLFPSQSLLPRPGDNRFLKIWHGRVFFIVRYLHFFFQWETDSNSKQTFSSLICVVVKQGPISCNECTACT